MKSYSAWVLSFTVFLLGPLAAVAPLGFAPLVHLAGLSGLIAYRLDHGRWPIPHNEPAKALGYFILFAAVSCLWSTAPHLAWIKLAEITAMALSAVILPLVVHDLPLVKLPGIRRAFLWGMGIGLVLFLGDILAGMPIQRLHKPAAAVALNFYNRGAILLGLFLWPAALIGFEHGRRLLAMAALVVYTAAIFFLQSHSEMIGMVLGLLVLAVAWRFPRTGRRGLSTLCGAGFVLAIPAALLLQQYGYDYSPHLQFSFRDRIQIWGFTAERILHTPYLGLGLMGSRDIPISDLSPGFLLLEGGKPPLHPHDIFLQIWLELGLAGVCLAYFLMAHIISFTKYLPRQSMSFALAGGAAYLAVASFAFGVWQGWWIAALVLLITCFLIASRMEKPGIVLDQDV